MNSGADGDPPRDMRTEKETKLTEQPAPREAVQPCVGPPVITDCETSQTETNTLLFSRTNHHARALSRSAQGSFSLRKKNTPALHQHATASSCRRHKKHVTFSGQKKFHHQRRRSTPKIEDLLIKRIHSNSGKVSPFREWWRAAVPLHHTQLHLPHSHADVSRRHATCEGKTDAHRQKHRQTHRQENYLPPPRQPPGPFSPPKKKYAIRRHDNRLSMS